MNKKRKRRTPPDPRLLLVRVNAIIDEWKDMAQRHFETEVSMDREAFEREWPEILANFFLFETSSIARALRAVFEGYEN